jgi:hypothetical protein
MAFGKHVLGHKMVTNWLVKLLGSVLGLACGLSGRHINWLWSKRELWWGFITKAVGFQLTIGIETWQSLIGVVG